MSPGGWLQVAFANGRLEEFYVHCNCLTPEQMREDEVAHALAVRSPAGLEALKFLTCGLGPNPARPRALTEAECPTPEPRPSSHEVRHAAPEP